MTLRPLLPLHALLLAAALAGCARDPAPEPSAAVDAVAQPAAVVEAPAADAWPHGALAAVANPYATDAAVQMLEQGGHAVDAAIAAHAVLGLVEPQSSGIGGGGFMLVYERAADTLVFHDGREVAPAGATPDMFMREGEAMGFIEAWQSGIAVGVPGAIALYRQAHEEHGRLPWAALFAPAIELAREGFVVSPRLANMLERLQSLGELAKNPVTAAYFFPEGEPLAAGDLRRNPDYADTLEAIAQRGTEAFYRGPLAEAIAAAAQAEPNPGTLTVEDIAGYEPRRRQAVCGPFRELRVCTASPPSSGAAQIMLAGIYAELAADAQTQEDRLYAFVDAQRLAYADRDRYFADPDSVDIPLEKLLDPRYLRARAADVFAPDAVPMPGDPAAVLGGEPELARFGPDTTAEIASTTHLSIVDGEGNAVALTASVEAPFGSARMVGGFLLNNQMTDFAREITPGQPLPANAVAPGYRPRSSMSPTMVFDAQGDLRLVTGSPGGNSIPAYVAKTLIGILDWGMSPAEAVAWPNIVARGEQVRVEIAEPQGAALAAQLSERGYKVQEREGENSGLHVILVAEDGLVGAADPRREGTVRAVAPAGNSPD